MTLRLAQNPRGYAVLRIQGLNANRPFQIEILDLNPGEKLPNDEILAATEAFVASLPVQESVPLERLCPKPSGKGEQSSPCPPSTSPPPSTTQNTSKPQGMSDHAIKLLFSLFNQPVAGASQRCQALGLSQGGFSRAEAELERFGLVTVVTWGRYRYLALTDKGRDHLALNHSIQAFPLPGKGSIEHRLAQQLVGRVYEFRGYQVSIESPIGTAGKLVDVLACKPGERVGIEVALGSSDEDENFIKDMAAGVLNKLVFVFPNGDTLKRWRTRFEARSEIKRDLHRTELMLLPHLLKEIAP